MIVLDATAFIDAVDGHPAVLQQLAGQEICAPHLIDVEVVSALRRLVASDRIAEPLAADVLNVLKSADIQRHPHGPLVDIIWSLRGRVSAYDATYVALAAALDATLVTTDRKLAKVSGLPCKVEVPV